MLRKLFRAAKSKKITFLAGLAVTLMALGMGVFGGAQASAADCEDNSIIYCGFTTKEDFIKKAKQNESHPGGSPNIKGDLQAIYKEAGLDPSEYDWFLQGDRARPGFVFRDGHIEVDGQTVATNTKTFGRWKSWHDGPNYEPWVIPGTSTTLHGNYPTRTFKSTTQKIPVLAVFNPDGTLKFVVETPCGNTMKYTKVVPKYECKQLHVDRVADKTYKFTTDTSMYNAKVYQVKYEFGDGTDQIVTDAGADGKFAFTHPYQVAKAYTAKVTVFVELPGKQKTFIAPAGDCVKQISIPIFECAALNAIYLDKDKTKLKVSFTATANYSGDGTEFKSADFYFGDDGNNVGKAGVLPNADKITATIDHTYVFSEDTKDTIKYNAKAVLHFTVNGQPVTADACPTTVTYEKVVQECKPGVPNGDDRCKPCPWDSSLTLADKDKCHPPELPNTGAGNTIAIFSGVVIGGFLVYRQLLFRKHRAAFNAARDGTSPLPLGDPMSDRPLDGTPLETKVHRSFRGKRRF